MSKHENKEIVSIKQQVFDVLAASLTELDPAYWTIHAILDRFLPSQFDFSSFSLKAYTQLSAAQERALHGKIKQSMIASSTTASGEAEKSGRIKQDSSPQSSKNAKKQLNLAYDFMVKLAKAKVRLSVEIVDELQGVLVPNYSGLRTENWLGKPGAFFVDPKQVLRLLQNLIDFINNPPPGMDLMLVKAIFQSVWLSLHPFHDGNGRTGMLLDLYLSILYNRIPQIFADPKQQTRFLIFTQLSTAGLKNGEKILRFEEAYTSGVTPSNLSPYCLKQLRDAGVLVPTTWTIGGKVQTHADMQAEIAKKIMQSFQTNHAEALTMIAAIAAPASPSLTDEEVNYDLFNYLLDTDIVSAELQKELLASSVRKSGEKLPVGRLSKTLMLNWNELNEKVQAVLKNPSQKNSQDFQNAVNRFQKLRTVIQDYSSDSDFVKSQDIYNLADFFAQIETILPQLEVFASAPHLHPLKQIWRLANDLMSMGKAMRIDRCYVSPLQVPIREFKTCSWEWGSSSTKPDPLELSQTNSAGRRLAPGGLPILAAALCASSGAGQVMLGIFACYQLGKQISKIFNSASPPVSRSSTSTVTLLSSAQGKPASEASPPPRAGLK